MNDINPHDDLAEYSSFASDVDLMHATLGKPARNIFIVDAGSGTLVVVTGSGSQRTLTGLLSNTYVDPGPTYFRTIKSTADGTNVAKVRVGW